MIAMAKPILLVKFPITLLINGMNIFSDGDILNNVEKGLSAKVEGEYHILITPINDDLISYEILSLKDDLTDLDFEDLKKHIINILKSKT